MVLVGVIRIMMVIMVVVLMLVVRLVGIFVEEVEVDGARVVDRRKVAVVVGMIVEMVHLPRATTERHNNITMRAVRQWHRVLRRRGQAGNNSRGMNYRHDHRKRKGKGNIDLLKGL